MLVGGGEAPSQLGSYFTEHIHSMPSRPLCQGRLCQRASSRVASMVCIGTCQGLALTQPQTASARLSCSTPPDFQAPFIFSILWPLWAEPLSPCPGVLGLTAHSWWAWDLLYTVGPAHLLSLKQPPSTCSVLGSMFLIQHGFICAPSVLK